MGPRHKPQTLHPRHAANASITSQPSPPLDAVAKSIFEANYSPADEPRTTATLNLRVLRRYAPGIASIISVAPFAAVYEFDAAGAQSWDKTGIEGTLFVVRLAGAPGSEVERYAVMVLNRKGMDNFLIELRGAEGVDVSDEFVIVQNDDAENSDDDEEPASHIYGLWIFGDALPGSNLADGQPDDARQLNARVMKECAGLAEESRRRAERSATTASAAYRQQPQFQEQVTPLGQYGDFPYQQQPQAFHYNGNQYTSPPPVHPQYHQQAYQQQQHQPQPHNSWNGFSPIGHAGMPPPLPQMGAAGAFGFGGSPQPYQQQQQQQQQQINVLDGLFARARMGMHGP